MLGWELPPHNSGGLGVACYQLCKAMARDGVDIEFIVPYTAQHDTPFMKVTPAHKQGARVILANGSAYDSYRYVHPDGHTEEIDIYSQQELYEHAVAQMMEGRTYDVVHAHDWLTFRAALRAKQATGAPLVLHVHSIEADRAGGKGGNPLVREIEATGLQLADRIIAVSELTKQAIIREYDIPADVIEVVHNSLDNDMINDLLEDRADNAYAYLTEMRRRGFQIVTSVGRLTVMKGVPNLLRAAQSVVRELPDTLFLISGSGEQYHELIAMAADLGIARNVIFTGFQRGRFWRDSFTIADLYVLPSVTEPFGITPLESIGFGTPTLISKQSGVAEILRSTLKVDFWDIDAMADKIVGALRNQALRDELIASAQAEVDRFSWHQAADKVFGIYGRQLEPVA